MPISESILKLDVETQFEEDSTFSLSSFLANEHARDLLRFATAGSVDDGKSTLIGRLLYDTQSVYEDQVRSITGKGTTGADSVDLALLTDGLRAEREQGITIDVAYRYFSNANRKFIIADTPGHEQYTRNMATGASTASLAIVLVDARKGVLTQSRRHACITALLGVRHIVVAVNKMDLVNYDEEIFNAIRADFTAFFDELGDMRPPHLYFVPVSALTGDNVVRPTAAMPWYEGPSLLELLESVPAAEVGVADPFRFAVQRVLRPNQDFRGFSGQIAAGTIHPGDTVMVLPSRRMSRVRSIVTFDGDLAQAQTPQSITLTLTDELDISRGDLIVAPESPAITTRNFTASLVWMDEKPLNLACRYLLKHTSRTVQVLITDIRYRLDVETLEQGAAETLKFNDIGLVEIESVLPLFVDSYSTNRITGSFVLIDPVTNLTVAAGMIRSIGAETIAKTTNVVTEADRRERWGHSGAHIHLFSPIDFADVVERTLFLRGAFIVRPELPSEESIAALTAGGALVLTHDTSEGKAVRFGEREIALSDVDDLLRFLEAQAIITGGNR
ncbi:sulfate adenylyltransferase subunit CysN [Tunturibacter empetritectus]|uniref:Sulfate adenylyltransferase subunit 1 n=1 Tax=Tunturiibacter empetritectus TaxID=3069691 RepID=A0A7W8IJ86_9BACT|nr:sulfate adenylyltransferase subunit CysN [Edaphobacter lichenicola]MBB5318167.1 sulfate adenylyltransferase large subunit [Edaphobacter lichenicola]